MAKSSCPTRGASLLLYKEAEHRLSRDSGGLVRIGAAKYFDLHTLSAPAWAIRRPLSRGQAANRARYRSRYLGPSRRGRAGLVIVSNEIREGEGPPRPCRRCPILNLCRAGAATARSRQTISPR